MDEQTDIRAVVQAVVDEFRKTELGEERRRRESLELRVNELAARATDLIRTLKIPNVSVKVFDGTYGWSDQAPFDRIIIAAAAPEVPQPLVQQLARTGVMVLPIGSEKNQRLARVRRVGTGVQIEDYGSAEFVPLVGRFGWKE